jgi:hypothetical protein
MPKVIIAPLTIALFVSSLSTVLAEVYRALPVRTCVRRGGFEGR